MSIELYPRRSPEVGLNLDVVMQTPILVVPRHERSFEVLVAHLGEITVRNQTFSGGGGMEPHYANADRVDRYCRYHYQVWWILDWFFGGSDLKLICVQGDHGGLRPWLCLLRFAKLPRQSGHISSYLLRRKHGGTPQIHRLGHPAEVL